MPDRDDEPKSNALAKYFRYSYVGIQFFLTIAICTGAGLWLDSYFRTKVLFTLVGLALGFGSGFYSLYRQLFPGKHSNEQDQNGN